MFWALCVIVSYLSLVHIYIHDTIITIIIRIRIRITIMIIHSSVYWNNIWLKPDVLPSKNFPSSPNTTPSSPPLPAKKKKKITRLFH